MPVLAAEGHVGKLQGASKGEPHIRQPLAELPSNASSARSSEPEGSLWYYCYLSVGLLSLIAVLYLIAKSVPFSRVATDLIDFVEHTENRAAQAVILVTFQVLLTVGCLPGPGFCMIFLGFAFGLWNGCLLSILGDLIGCFISTVLSRSCCRDRVRRWLLSSKTMRTVVRVCEEEDSTHFLVLFRFLFIPLWLKNYGIALLEISTARCLAICLPSAIFFSAVFSYVGSKTADISKRAHSDQGFETFSPVEISIISVTVMALIGIMFFGWRVYHDHQELNDD